MASVSAPQHCLLWKHFQCSRLEMFDDLFKTKLFSDVTLACEGVRIKSHKIVLAYGSSYFREELLNNDDCKHPIIFLADVKLNELQTILELMYRGKVAVAQDRLVGVMDAAEKLKVEGLTLEKRGLKETPSSNSQVSADPWVPGFQRHRSEDLPPPLQNGSSTESIGSELESSSNAEMPKPQPSAPVPQAKKNTFDRSNGKFIRLLPPTENERRPTVSPYGPNIQVRNMFLGQCIDGGSTVRLNSSPGGGGPVNKTGRVRQVCYKQYTYISMRLAVDSVMEGTSVLKAARKFNIPPSTLYLKLRQLGISAPSVIGHGNNEHSTEPRRNGTGNGTLLSGTACEQSCESLDSSDDLELLDKK